MAIAAEPDAFADAPLRWKAKPLGVTRVIADSAVPVAAAPAGGWNKTRIDGQVRPAQFTTTDPFSDPFGDSAAAVQPAQSIELEPTEAESGRPGATFAAGAQELPQHEPSPLRLSPPVTEPAAQEHGEFIAQPAFPAPAELPPRERDPACERIYNDRNCCDLDADCKAFRERIISDSIRNMSLDITPRFEPNLTAEEDAASRQDRLSAADKIREWRNKRGEVLATGRMSDLAGGRVVIVDEDNKEVARLSLHEIGNDELCWVNAWWRLPGECALGERSLAARNWLPSTYQFHASALCHKPLYFEEVQLERYGHTAGPIRQPILSGAHFFLNIAALPYKMAINPVNECQYALGYYRPGSCAPWMIQPIPLSLRGALAETGAVVGGIYLIP